MTLDDAIAHAREAAAGCGECDEEHAQLADWLEELRAIKTLKGGGEECVPHSEGGEAMSYRLIDSNALAMGCAEVNDMPCIYADLPNGLDGGHYDMTDGGWECEIVITWKDSDYIDDVNYSCSECGGLIVVDERNPDDYFDVISHANYCCNCGRRVIGVKR